MTYTDLEIIKGKTFSETIAITDANGAAFSLSGYNGRASVRANYGESGVLTPLDVTITSITGGLLTLGLAATGSTGLPTLRSVYELEIYTTSDATVTQLLQGYVNIQPEVARTYSV